MDATLTKAEVFRSLMRILLYADRPAAYGGIETHTAGLAEALSSLGDEVTIAFSSIVRPDLFTRSISAGARVVELQSHQLGSFVRQEGFDVIHAHSYGASRAVKQLGVRPTLPVITTVHGPGQRLPFPPMPGTGLICVSEEVARVFRPAFGQRLRVIENGIDLDRFSALDRSRKPGEPLRICYLGRVGPTKRAGVTALYEAAGKRADVRLRFISDWAPHAQASPTCSVEEHLQHADVVFSTGRGIREAMACGAAACVLGVCWDGLVTPDSLDRLAWYNFSGRAFRRKPASQDIALVIRRLLFDPRLLEQLKCFGRQTAERRWDGKTAAILTRKFYAEVMGEV